MTDYLRINRDAWTDTNARYTDAQAKSAWARSEFTWGVWNTPEREVGVLPDVAGKDVIELGCGTAYVAAWLKRRGARRVVGVDITPAQLATAAARLLRTDGELVFLRNSTLSARCMPERGKAQERLQRPQLGMRRLEWTDDDPGVEFQLGHGELLRLLRRSGFEILDLVEIFASENAADHEFHQTVPVEWARKWPAEELWRARKLKGAEK